MTTDGLGIPHSLIINKEKTLKVARKLLNALIILLVLAVGTVIGLRLFFNKDLIDQNDSKIIISTYAKSCQTTPDKIQSLWESAASSAINKDGQSLDEALWEYNLEYSQRSAAGIQYQILEKLYALIGYDPYRQIEQKALKAANQMLLDDMQICFRYKVFGEQPSTTPPASAEKSPPTPAESTQFFQDAAQSATVEYTERWRQVQAEPRAYLEPCITEEKSLLMSLGWKSADAEKTATETCQAQLSELTTCMNTPSASATACFTEVLERGD